MAFLQPGELQGSPPGQGNPLEQGILLPLDTQCWVVLQESFLLLLEDILQEQQDRCTAQQVGRQTPVLWAEIQKKTHKMSVLYYGVKTQATKRSIYV